MKKLLIVLLMIALTLTMAGCGGSSGPALSTDNVTVDGVFIDESYVDQYGETVVNEDGEEVNLVCVYYTLTPQKGSMKTSSEGIQIVVGEGDESKSFSSKHIPHSSQISASYMHSSFIETCEEGETMKAMAVIEVPKSLMTEEQVYSLSSSEEGAEDFEKISFTAAEIQSLPNKEEIAKVVDKEGYDAEMAKREPADDATKASIKAKMDGYEWTFGINNVMYTLAFYAPNNFDLSTTLVDNSGTYEITNGYIILSYPNIPNAVYLPYEMHQNGELELDTIYAFDVQSH